MCFVRALITYGVTPQILQSIKQMICGRDFPCFKIKSIAEENKLYITVKRVDANHKIYHYGTKTENPIKLGLLSGHYFLIKKIDITKYALANFFYLSHNNKKLDVCNL